MTLSEQWREAVSEIVIRHLDWTSTVVVEVIDGDQLVFRVVDAKDTRDGSRMPNLMISTVKLGFFPGKRAAQAWVAAAWAGYLQHEALELVTFADLKTRPLDPHAEPYCYDRDLRECLPAELTPATMRRALATVMSAEAAEKWMADAG